MDKWLIWWKEVRQTITAGEVFMMELGKEDVETDIATTGAARGTKTWSQSLLRSNALAPKTEFSVLLS